MMLKQHTFKQRVFKIKIKNALQNLPFDLLAMIHAFVITMHVIYDQ